MSFTLPFPSTPTNGNLGDATPILANETALAQAISAFDGSQINSKTVTAGALADAINPQLRYSENFANYVDSGCTWASVSGLNGTMTGGTIYVNGYRIIVSGVGSHTFTASNDTYIDIDYLGNIYYNGVANNATAPSLTANSLRVAKVVTGGSTISSVTLSGADGIGNIIYPSGPVSSVQIQNPYKFSVWQTAAQNAPSGNTKVKLDTKIFDTGNNFDAVTNNRFVAPVAGHYFFTGIVGVLAAADTAGVIALLYKNGAVAKNGAQVPSGASGTNISVVSGLLQLVATDYVELFIQNTEGTTRAMVVGNANQIFMDGFLMSTS